MPRVPFATRDDIVAAELPAYDEFLNQRGGTMNTGPLALMLHMPELALKFEDMRLYIRADPSISPVLKEIAMLMVARETDAAYIWFAHAAAARAAGVRGEIIDAIRDKRDLTGLTADEQLVVDYSREQLRNRKVSRATFDRASARFGKRGTMTLTSLICGYAMLANFMNTYELEAPAHPTEKPLPV
jgi:4-carboxymuconolactone decarboxylase